MRKASRSGPSSGRGRIHGSLNYDALSAREREVMLLAARGFANKTIARELDVSEGTVKLHLHRVYRKLGVKGRFALAALTFLETSRTG
ncbi:MAG TPA: helix-turn-helix transcriptional regulator [Xanthobacteraceae bacterium]|nr:helix-turn-helix transcriptional regulator [Xanthobacteraceae bacterium]